MTGRQDHPHIRSARGDAASPLGRSSAALGLSALIALLAAVAAGAGLFWQDGGGPSSFTTLRGQTVQPYGQGLYRYDTLFLGAGNRGTDAITLLLGVPLLVYATWLRRRGSLRGALLHVGMLGYFLYVYASLALGAAYNSLFLVYVALVSASLFAFVLAFRAVVQRLTSSVLDGLPRHGPASYLFASGLVTLVVWLGPLLATLASGEPPDKLDSYTTMVTYALDLGIIVPSCFLAGSLILRREPLGYAIAFPLLVLIVMLLPAIVAQTVSQLAAGVPLTPGEIVGPVSGFATLGLIAIWVIASIFRGLSAATPSPAAEN